MSAALYTIDQRCEIFDVSTDNKGARRSKSGSRVWYQGKPCRDRHCGDACDSAKHLILCQTARRTISTRNVTTYRYGKFQVVIVEDVPLELKGTEGIFKNEIPEAVIIGTADNEQNYFKLMKQHQPDLVLLDLGLGGSTTVGVELCRYTKENYPGVKVLIFTGEILNEKLWVDVLDAGCDGIILKSGELLTRGDVASCMSGKRLVFNQPILEKIVERFKHSVGSSLMRTESLIDYEIDEYDERFLRHLALGYTKEQITNLRGMPFGVKSLEKRQNELVQKLFPDGNRMGVNATRLVVRALELRILDIDNLHPDEE